MPSITVTITREIEAEVEYTYKPGSPGTFFDPPDSAEVEILTVKPTSAFLVSEFFVLTSDEEQNVVTKILDNPPSNEREYERD